MNFLKFSLFTFILILGSTAFAQQSGSPKITVTGTIIEKVSKQPLEYATVAFIDPKALNVAGGGVTDSQGKFSVDIAPGVYDAKFEFISFKELTIPAKSFLSSTNMGVISLSEESTQLDAVVVRGERTTVEIKLDKKVYNVGQDLMVKGGTVSDVLDNIPSVTVDADGTIALRGNENVRILIDGRPSSAINITEALRLIPADAIEKVEVVTNPSARYDSEGGGGLLNIILKKGKNQGFNGTVIASAGDPESYGISGNVNYKTEAFNLFTTTGYDDRSSKGIYSSDSRYLNADNSTRNYIDEKRTNKRQSQGVNSNVGLDWYLDKNTTWSNSINIRHYNNQNPESVTLDNFDANRQFLFTDYRFNDQIGEDRDVQYATNLSHDFKREGHKVTVDAAFSANRDNDTSSINFAEQTTANDQERQRNFVQVDYVLPFKKESRFEAGYKGEFSTQLTDYQVNNLDADTGLYSADYRYTNILDYRENINAVYTQLGSKFGKFSVLLGLRYEDSKIVINQLTSNDFNTKKYSDLFPSAFITYEIGDQHNIALSYSRRISRPRGRQINPFSNFSSNINIFKGNPDLDPSYSDAYDLGYLKRWSKLTLNSSIYFNKTTQSVQYVRRESGDFVTRTINGISVQTPVILTSPVNLSNEYRTGFEFTANYSPFKVWKVNGNFNFFRNQTQGDYTYGKSDGTFETQNFDYTAYSWFARLTSKLTLPYKIDSQTNISYYGPQNTAQGKSYGIASANIGFSKDLFKEKATVALNVQDIFNSRRRKYDTFVPGSFESTNSFQWRTRQITASFTYRFNKKKDKRERQQGGEGGGEDFPG